jgi:hypothetical protein
MKPFKFFDKTWKPSVIYYNPYQDLVIDMIRECNRLNISLVGVQETVYNRVFNHRIMDIHIYNDWHGDNVDVTYLVDEGGTYHLCRFTMEPQEFITKTSQYETI